MLLKLLSLPFNLTSINEQTTHASFNEKRFPPGFLAKTALTIGKVRCVWLGNKDFAPSFRKFLLDQTQGLHKYTVTQHPEIMSQIEQAKDYVEKASQAFVRLRGSLSHIEDCKRTIREQKPSTISKEVLQQLISIEDELKKESLPANLTQESAVTYVNLVNEVLEKMTPRLKIISIIPATTTDELEATVSKESPAVASNDNRSELNAATQIKKPSAELKKKKNTLKAFVKQHILQLEGDIKKFSNEHVQLLSSSAKSNFANIYENRLKMWNELLEGIVSCKNETQIKPLTKRFEMQVKVDEGIEETLFAITDFGEAVMEIPSSSFCSALRNSQEAFWEKHLADMIKCECLSNIEKSLQEVQLHIDGQNFLIKRLRQSTVLQRENEQNLPVKPLEFSLIKSICSDIAQEGFSILNASNLSVQKISAIKLSLDKVKEMTLSLQEFEVFIDSVQLPREWKYFSRKSLIAIQALIIAGQHSNEAFLAKLRDERDVFTSMGFSTIEQHFNVFITQLNSAREPFTDASKITLVSLNQLETYARNWEIIITKLSKQSSINRLKESERALQKTIARIRARIIASNGEIRKALQLLLKSAPTYKEKNQIKNSTDIEAYIQKTDNLIKNPLAH